MPRGLVVRLSSEAPLMSGRYLRTRHRARHQPEICNSAGNFPPPKKSKSTLAMERLISSPNLGILRKASYLVIRTFEKKNSHQGKKNKHTTNMDCKKKTRIFSPENHHFPSEQLPLLSHVVASHGSGDEKDLGQGT